MNRTVLRRIGLVLLAVAGGTLLLVAILVANVDRLTRSTLTYALSAQLGTGVRLDDVRLGFRDSSLLLRNLVVSNPPGFGPRALLVLPELYVAYDPDAAASNRVRFRDVRLHLGELNLEVDAQGRTNVMELAVHAARSRGLDPERMGTQLLESPEFTNRFEGIDRLTLTLGRIAYRDRRNSARDLDFQLGFTNRTFSHVTSPVQLMPLVVDILTRGGSPRVASPSRAP
ncbi:MAG: hypothetical protein JNL10_07605 [Verrucomicrobiales bacterium]|nr:hypothetical protein [Verrucomicrobiales bacterium]